MKTFIYTLICLFSVVSCTKISEDKKEKPIVPDNPDKSGIYFDEEEYKVSSKGGEMFTSVANMDFVIATAEVFPLILEPDHIFYTAQEDGKKLTSDFYTAEKTDDWKIKFTVSPNNTGKEKKHIIVLQRGNIFGDVFLIQAAN